MPALKQELVRKFEILAKASMDGYWLLDSTGQIIVANQVSCRMYGYSPEELPGKHLRDFEAIEDDGVMQTHMARIMADGYDRFETRHYRKDGGCIDVEVSASFIPEDGIFIAFTRDITRRKQAEDALIAEKSFLRSLIDSASDAIYFKDANGIYIGCNKAAEKLIGITEKEQIGKSDFDFFDHDFAEAIQKKDKIVFEGGETVRVEEWLTSADGERVLLDSVKAPIYRPDGQIIGLLGISRDITAFKQAELKLKKSEQEFRLTFEDASDAIFWADATTGILINCNRAAEEMLELPRAEIIGKHQTFLHPPDMEKHFADLFKKTSLTHDHVDNAEAIVISKSGRRSLVHIKHSVTSIDGRLIMQGMFRDVTEQMRAEQSLLESEERFRVAQEMSLDAFTIFTAVRDNLGAIVDFRWVYANPEACRILRHSPGELIGRRLLELFPGNSSESDIFAKYVHVMNTGQPFDNELRYQAEGMDGWFRIMCVKIADDVAVSFADITERKRGEEDRLKLEQQLLQAQKLESLGVLAGGIAHDFNNILTGIIGNISQALKFIDEAHKSTLLLQKAEKAAIRASNLSNQLLTFAKGGQPIKKVVSVKHILNELVDFMLSGSNISCITELAEDLLAIEVDEGQILQVLLNIINNAAQAMPGGGTIAISAENIAVDADNMMSLAPGKFVRLTVTDKGCGIPEEDQRKIFDPYFTTKAGGSGLGLATTRSIIVKHAGYIGVRSSVGVGTSIEILLPGCDNESAHNCTESPPAEGGLQSGKSVLLMDDEEIIRDITYAMLSYAGYFVQTCSNGDEAIALFKAAAEAGKPYSAVIMDLTVPGGMGGREAARHILAFDPQARLIVSSGYSDDPVMAEYARFGFCAVIMKPYNEAGIARVVKSVLP